MQNIFFPVETIARELDYRLLLAAKILKKDRRVYICNHRHLDKIMHRFRSGIYVGKHIFHSLMPVEDWKQYEKAKRLGIDIVYLQEEGGIFEGVKTDWGKILDLQCDPRRFDSKDRICEWGEWQKSVHGREALDVPLIATGHPRFDLCKEKYKDYYKPIADQLNQTYGSFILINGNYAYSNHGIGIETIFSPRLGYDPADAEKRQKFVDFFVHSSKSMVDMISLVHRLSTAFPDKTFIYRSHPSEGDHLYKYVFAGLPNVKCIHEGPVGPWLLAAETIVHDGCTTAIEASFSNARIINYKVTSSKEHDIRLPNLVGTIATNAKEVIEMIRSGKPRPISNEAFSELDEMIANYHLDSFETVANVIEDKLTSMGHQNAKAPSIATLKLDHLKHQLKKVRKRTGHRKIANEYQKKKFPGINLKDINAKIARASKCMECELNLVYADSLMLVLGSNSQPE